MNSKALVIFPGALGDFVCFLPALEEIGRRAGNRPRLLCPRSLTSLVTAAGVADPQAIEDPQGGWLFSSRPPVAADHWFGTFGSAECFTGYGIPEVAVNLRSWLGPRARIHPFRPAQREHLTAHFLRCIGAATNVVAPRVELSAEALDSACGMLRSMARPLLVVHPGSGGRKKRWSRSGFRTIADRWCARGGGAVVVLGPAEPGEASDWRSTGLPLLTDIDLPALAAVLAAADLYLGNDSGVSHLAAAVGARGVALFGPTDPELWRPQSRDLRVVRPMPWAEADDEASAVSISMVERELSAAAAGVFTLTR